MSVDRPAFVLATVRGSIACDAFRSVDDGLSHAIVLAGDGQLTDVTYEDGGRVRAVRGIGRAEGARDVTAFWSDVDDMRNVIAVGADGLISHFRQKGEAEWTRIRRRDVPDALRVAGYDDHHHGIVLTGAGRISDEPFHGVTASVQQTFVRDTAAALTQSGRADAAAKVVAPTEEEPAIPVATLPDAVDIGALWADGQNRFVIAAEASGAITELGYGAHQPETRRVLASIRGVARINACYVDDPATGRCVIALTRDGDVHALRYAAAVPRGGGPITRRAAAKDVACFASADGHVRVVLQSGDEVIEVPFDDDARGGPG
jgi:hypothetical protein